MAFATIVLAAAFSVTGLIIWLVTGLIAGFIASRLMSGGGYGQGFRPRDGFAYLALDE
jgi:hypothetical protein